MAGAEGIRAAFARARDPSRMWTGSYVWRVDNTVAESWLKRGWLPEWDLNATLVAMRQNVRAAQSDVTVTHIPGVENRAADMLTRCVTCPRGAVCTCSGEPVTIVWRAACACEAVCEHVTVELQHRLARVYGVTADVLDLPSSTWE